MKKGHSLVLVGLVLSMGGLIGGWAISKIQEGEANVAVVGGAPAEVLAAHMRTALSATAIGYAICALGIVLVIAGLIARSRTKKSQVHAEFVIG